MSKFTAGFILFLTINLVLLAIHPLKGFDPELLPAAKSWTWWAKQNLQSEVQPPHVVLLGSSLMMTPVWENEADFQNKDVDIVLNRHVTYLDAALKKVHAGSEAKCFNMALPGAMISDDYMVVKALLTRQSNKPDVVVLGLSPRDLLDNGFTCAASSQHFKYLSRFIETDDLTELAMPKFWQRSTYYMKKVFYLEGQKIDLQLLANDWWKREVCSVAGTPSEPKTIKETSNCENTRCAIYESELESGKWLAHPHGADYYDAKSDAHQRKKLANKEGFENQSKWLEKCLDLCHQEGIKVVVVNMPITQKNVSLFHPDVYHKCIALMESEAKRFGFAFINLQLSSAFEMKDFTDMCHLDASGGKKLLDAVATEIGTDKVAMKNLSIKKGLAEASSAYQ